MRLRRVEVEAPQAKYPVVIGAGARARLVKEIVAHGSPSRLHLITDETVDRRHGRELVRHLESAGIPLAVSRVPAGEQSKSPRQLTRLWRDMLRAGCDRRACVVAFGGGVVGDLAGFTAASVLRGIDFVQVPTTLLAMVDASVGGKTGINLPEGKNLVGAFHQPRAVVMDLDYLGTLSARQFRAGCAEVVKTAAIWKASFFRELEARTGDLLAREPKLLARVVSECVRIKAAVVAADEREARLRMILNFGHTFGHALEAAGRYRDLLHGEAVAIGMIFAARLGERLEVSSRGTAERLRDVLRGFKLPVAGPKYSLQSILRSMLKDKKRGADGLRWVLLPRIGKAEIIENVSMDIVREEAQRFLGRPARAKGRGRQATRSGTSRRSKQ